MKENRYITSNIKEYMRAMGKYDREDFLKRVLSFLENSPEIK